VTALAVIDAWRIGSQFIADNRETCDVVGLRCTLCELCHASDDVIDYRFGLSNFGSAHSSRTFAMLTEVPPTTRVVFATMPVHAVAQPVPGSREGQREDACKMHIATLAGRYNSVPHDDRANASDRCEIRCADDRIFRFVHSLFLSPTGC
jgi:hypothetical protein